MRLIVIPVVIDAIGMFSKGMVRELEELKNVGRSETIQTTTLLRSARILRRVLETLTPVKYSQLTRQCEKHERGIIMIIIIVIIIIIIILSIFSQFKMVTDST